MKQYYDFFFKENKPAPKREAIALLCSSYNLHFINIFYFFTSPFFFKAMRQYYDCLNNTT